MGPPDAVRHPHARLWLLVEGAALTVGVACLLIWLAARVDRAASERRAMARFAALSAARTPHLVTPDTSLWSPERVVAWRAAVKDAGPAPLAVLRIPKIHLEVPVLEGTDDLTLNRGAGHHYRRRCLLMTPC